MPRRAHMVTLLMLAAARCLAAEGAAPAGRFPHGRISGQVFAEYYYNVVGGPRHAYNAAGADTLNSPNIDGVKPIGRDLNGFQIRRVYLQLDSDLSARVSSRLRLEADGRSLTSDGKVGVALKTAHLHVRRAVPQGDLIFGLLDTPTWDLSEEIWQYRSVEKTIADFRGIGGRADFGAALRGSLDGAKHVGYAAMIGNGAGQRPEDNRHKKLYLALPVNAGAFRLEPYADYESGPGSKDRATYKLFAGYVRAAAAIGIEALDRVNHRPEGGNQEPRGLSIFARAVVPANLAAFARLDLWQPDRRARDRVDSQLWIVGLDWRPVTDLHVMPNVEATQYLARGAGVVPSHHDLQARVTVHYRFGGP